MERYLPRLLQQETRHFDENFFYSNYESLDWKDQTLRHIAEHISKAGFKLIEFRKGQAGEDIITEQVIPDLAIYRTQVINLLNIDPDEIDWDLETKSSPEEQILWAVGMISRYLEPLEHEKGARHESLTYGDLLNVPLALHLSATYLAQEFDIDLVEAQKKRMKR